MREILQLLFEKLHFGAEGQTTLIGSPGVGTSIFLFLAALRMARTKTVAFLRRSRASCYVSAFIMQSSSSGGGHGCNYAARTNVDVRFIRDYQKDATTAGSLAFFDGLAKIVLGSNKFGEFVKFIDGTYYKEVPVFNFLCTSDGRPLFKSDEGDQYCLVLDGWTRDEAVSALGLQGINKEKANEAYRMCGGSIRAMIDACRRDDTTIHQRVSELLEHVTKNKVVVRSLDFLSTSRGKDLKTHLPDELLTMFRDRASDADSDKRMVAIQYVDSSFALLKLAEVLDVALFQDGYDLAIVMKNQTGQDMFYGLLIHKCIEHSVRQQSAFATRYIRKVCCSKGTGAQGVKELEGDVYWIPSSPNFAIDAAIVLGGNFLHAFQYTVAAQKYSFDRARFEADFLCHIIGKFDTLSENVMVHFVAPITEGWKLPSDYVF